MKPMNWMNALMLIALMILGNNNLSHAGNNNNSNSNNNSTVRYGTEAVDGIDIFYRESGDPSKQTVVLLHGFPHSSHQYREVLAQVGDQYHVIAPDYPGFGDSAFPSVDEYTYTFDNIAQTMDKFLEQRGLDRYVLMIHDYGAPIGFRIATQHPERVAGLVVMNGNAYIEGLNNEVWAPIMAYWKNKNDLEIEQAIIKKVFSNEGLKWQYTHGTRNPEGILPDSWNLDIAKFARAGQHRLQLNLFYDYQNNVKQYPKWQQYLRDQQPPMLIVWGKNDAFFPASGAEAYKRDVQKIDFNILNTGHFALEEDSAIIIKKMRQFLSKRIQ